jgi:ATP-binding cassette subfamily B protein
MATGVRSAVAYVRERIRSRVAIARLLPLAGTPLAASATACNLLVGLAPIGFVIATSVVVGRLPGAVQGGWHSPDGRALVWGIAAAGIFLAVLQGVSPLLGVLGERISRRVDGIVRDRLAAASAGSSTIAALEDQELLGYLSEAGGNLEFTPFTPGRAVSGLVALINRYAPVVTAAVLIGIVFSWLAALAIFTGAMLIRYGTRRGLVVENGLWRANMSNLRESWYFRGLALEPPAGKELRIFGLVPWTQRRHRDAYERAWGTHWPVRRRLYTTLMGSYAAVGAVFAAGALVWLGHAAANGDISLRDTAFVLQAGVIIVRVGLFFMEADLGTEFGMSAYQALGRFEEKAGRYSAAASGTRSADGLPREAIRFEQVSFAYPGSEHAVLDGLDLVIPAGGSLAIVGLNGAGKTTLIKLLARLYEPTSGRITVDGVDIRELELDGWRSRIAAIFQDFVHYELPVADNIALGSVSHLGDEPAIRRAARRAGALELIDGLPAGLATPLSARYTGGVDVSGGQWQRIALSRALFALEQGTSVLVLDEPTANLDVRGEAELFDRFLEITGGATTILISHRFSTVRHAERIVVLEHGAIVEQGTHDELVARGGRYEQLFRLQAARFDLGEEEES